MIVHRPINRQPRRSLMANADRARALAPAADRAAIDWGAPPADHPCNRPPRSRHRTGVEISGDDFEDLVRPYVEPAFRLAFAMLRGHADAEDAVQESVTRAWRKIRQLRDPALFRPWFLAIVANQCRASMRSSWWSVLRLHDDHVERDDRAPDDVIGSLDLRGALRRLGPEDRAALVLFYALDLPLEEVAAALRVSQSAAKARIHRAAGRLRAAMGEEVPR